MKLKCFFLGHYWRAYASEWVAYNKVKRYHEKCKRCWKCRTKLVTRYEFQYEEDKAW